MDGGGGRSGAGEGGPIRRHRRDDRLSRQVREPEVASLRRLRDQGEGDARPGRVDEVERLLLGHAEAAALGDASEVPGRDVRRRRRAELLGGDLRLWPRGWTMENFQRVLSSFRVITWFGNSIAISVVVALITGDRQPPRRVRLRAPALPSSNVLFLVALSTLMIPLIALKDNSLFTLPIGLLYLQGQFGSDYGATMAFALLNVTPMVILFLVFQRYFVQGFARSGIR